MRLGPSRCGSSINVAVVFAAFLLLASHIMTGLANSTSTAASADSEQQPQAPEQKSAAEKSPDIGAATHGRRRSSTRSSWCDVDVVQFDESDAANTATEKRSPEAKLGISIQNLLNKFRKTETKKTTGSGGITFPPKTIAGSAWMRGIPTDTETTSSKAGDSSNAACATNTNTNTAARRKLKLPKIFQKSTKTKTPPPLTIQDIKSWHFDPLQHTAEALIPVFSQTLLHYDLPSKYSLDIPTLDRFARRVMERHGDPSTAPVPYHNWWHGVSAVHMTFCILTLGGADAYLADDEILALLFGALIHDVDHPGTNNAYEVARKTDLAQKYNDNAVLEANSVDVAYDEILTEEGCDIFHRLREEEGRADEVQRILHLARDYVLATDATDHGNMLDKLVKIAEGGGLKATCAFWNKNDPTHRTLLAHAIIHTADISNPAAPSFVIARDWCLRISREFHRQVNEERRLGLPVAAYMDGLDDEYAIAKQQQAFYKFMALPLFEVLGTVLPQTAVLEKWARQNLAEFDAIVEAVKTWRKEQEQPEEDAKLASS